jgi:type VI secretion system protein ImpB
MALDNYQKAIGKTRPPRVQIEYDVETGGALKKEEIPFIMGVMADLSGSSLTAKKPIESRDPIEITSASFNAAMRKIAPRVAFRVENKINEKEGELPVELTFTSMEDFTPEGIARQVAPLKELLETREQLQNLLNSMQGKPDVEKLIGQLVSDPALREALSKAPGQAAAGGDASETKG